MHDEGTDAVAHFPGFGAGEFKSLIIVALHTPTTSLVPWCNSSDQAGHVPNWTRYMQEPSTTTEVEQSEVLETAGEAVTEADIGDDHATL